MASKKAADAPKGGRLRVKAVPLPTSPRMTAQDARKALLSAVNGLSESQLQNFRGGQILIVR